MTEIEQACSDAHAQAITRAEATSMDDAAKDLRTDRGTKLFTLGFCFGAEYGLQQAREAIRDWK